MTVSPEDLAARLMRRHALRRRREAQLRQGVVQRLWQEACPLLRGASVQRAWLIGSLASGHFCEGSDADIVVEGLDIGRCPALWAELSDCLGVEVDLLRFEELSPAFQQRVVSEGVLLDVA